ncbi:MAG: hypothetical protein V1813_00975 [Candidatus Aenigmatarchaeota archaeon]
MERAKAFAVTFAAALLVIASATVSASDATGNDTLEGCGDGCSTAVGTVNVTLLDSPPAFSGFFLFEPFDFSGLFSAASAALSSALSLLGL